MAHHNYQVTDNNGKVQIYDLTEKTYIELTPEAAIAMAGKLVASAYDVFGQPIPDYIQFTDAR